MAKMKHNIDGMLIKFQTRVRRIWKDEAGVGTVEVVLLILGIFTPYYGVGIRCMA